MPEVTCRFSEPWKGWRKGERVFVVGRRTSCKNGYLPPEGTEGTGTCHPHAGASGARVPRAAELTGPQLRQASWASQMLSQAPWPCSPQLTWCSGSPEPKAYLALVSQYRRYSWPWATRLPGSSFPHVQHLGLSSGPSRERFRFQRLPRIMGLFGGRRDRKIPPPVGI